MALSDIISIPFLISLGITLLLVGLIGVFFSQRLQEQNHKIESMFGIISTMAEEMNYMREKIQGGRTHNESKKEDKKTATDSENVLIDVSDDSSDDSDSSSDCDDCCDSDSDSDSDSSITENKILNCIKVINFGESLTISEKIESEAESMSDVDDLDGDDLDGDDLDELDDLEELDNKKISEDTTLLNSNSFKSINISNLEETKEFESLDYKKMSLNKLRSISLSKGLDASKLKKTDILKLLGLEC